MELKQRSLTDMYHYICCAIENMDIALEYKIELYGMITALYQKVQFYEEGDK